MKVCIKPDFLIRDIAGEQILIGAGEQIDFSQMLILNDTSTWVIKTLQEQSLSPEELTQRLTNEYEVDYTEALNDVNELIHELEALGVVEIKNWQTATLPATPPSWF